VLLGGFASFAYSWNIGLRDEVKRIAKGKVKQNKLFQKENLISIDSLSNSTADSPKTPYLHKMIYRPK